MLADFMDCDVRSQEAQAMIREQLAVAKNQGVKKVGYLRKHPILESPLNQLLLGDPQTYSFFESEDEALQWFGK